MDKWARYGAATGIAAIVLFAVGFFVTPELPEPDAPASEAATYFADEQDGIQIGAAFLAASAVALLWFLATLTAVLRRAEGGPRLSSTVFGAGVITIALFMADVTAFAVGAFRPENMQASPELAQALMDFSLLTLGVGSLVFAGFFLAIGVLSLRNKALPGWLGWTALVAAVLTAFRLGSIFTTDGVFAADGVLGFWAGVVAFAAWTLAASITLVESLGRPDGGGITGRVRGAVTGAAEGAIGRRNG
jgi:hypothetical protein